MPNQNALVWNQQQFGYVQHTSVSGDTWQKIKNGVTTSAGAAGGTTLVDTQISTSANEYNGEYWIRIVSGALIGKWKRIVDNDGSGTITLENNGFEAQVASGVDYELWQTPEPVIVVESSSGATDVVDATRSEAAFGGSSKPYWVGYWVCPISGSRRGEKAQVTNHTAGTGTFVVGTGFSGALAAGDVCVLRKFVEVGDLSASLSEDYNPRPANRVNFSRGDGVVGPRGGTVGFSTQVMPTGSAPADGVGRDGAPISGLLAACGFDEIVGATVTVSGSGSSTTVIDIATATWEKVIRPGTAVVYDGNVRFVTDITDGGGGVDQLTVSPALPKAPAASDIVYVPRSYFKSVTGDTYGVTMEWEVDGIRTTMTGCKGNVTVNPGATVTMAWEFSVDHWIREIEAAPYDAGTTYTTQAAILESDRLCYVDTTATSIGGFTCTAGCENAPKNVQGAAGINGRAGFHTVNVGGGGTFREILASGTDSLPQDLKFTVRTAFGLFVIYGSHNRCFAVRVPNARIVQSPHPADAGGVADAPTVFEAQDAGVVQYGASDGTTSKVPDFAFFLS